MSEAIHKVGDGLGPRDVFLDGDRVEGCVYADTELGVVELIKQPFVVVDDELQTERKYGNVTVVFR